MLRFPLKPGDKFQDERGNVVTINDYDDVTGCLLMTLDEYGIQFVQPRAEFHLQYLMGIIREVCRVFPS